MAEDRSGVSPSSIELAASRARDEELGRDADDDADDDDVGDEENAPLVHTKRSDAAAADAADSAPSSASSRGELTRGMLLYAFGVAFASCTTSASRCIGSSSSARRPAWRWSPL
jgi:hypothetical protein